MYNLFYIGILIQINYLNLMELGVYNKININLFIIID